MRWLVLLALAACGRIDFDPIPRRVMYVAATAPDQIFGFAIHADGALAPLPGSPYATKAVGLDTLVVDPQGRFVIAGGTGMPALATFLIADNGALTQVDDADYTANQIHSLALVGEHVYAGNANDRVIELAIDPLAGTITQRNVVTVSATASFVTTDALGRYLIVPGEGTSCGVSVSVIDASGALEPEQLYRPATCLITADGCATDAEDRFIYVTNDVEIRRYPFDAASGAIAVGSETTSPDSSEIQFTVLSPDGELVFATSYTGISRWTVDLAIGPDSVAAGYFGQLVFASGSSAYALGNYYGTPHDPELYSFHYDGGDLVPRTTYTLVGKLAGLGIAQLP